VIAAIDRWLSGLVSSAINQVLGLLADTVLSTPALTGSGTLVRLWQSTLAVADATLLLFVLAGGVILMSRETLQTRYAVKEIAPRWVIGAVAANASLWITGQCITLANALARALLGNGVSPSDVSVSLGNLITNAIANNIFITFVALVFAVLIALVFITYLVRIALTLVLIAGAPIMLVCHCLPQTEGLARLWWRAFTGCLGVQLAQSLILVAAIRVVLNGQSNIDVLNPTRAGSALVDLLVGCCLMYLLIRVPVWITHMVLGSGHRSQTFGMIRSVVAWKALSALGIMGGRRGRSGGGGGLQPGHVRTRTTRSITTDARGGTRLRTATVQMRREQASGKSRVTDTLNTSRTTTTQRVKPPKKDGTVPPPSKPTTTSNRTTTQTVTEKARQEPWPARRERQRQQRRGNPPNGPSNPGGSPTASGPQPTGGQPGSPKPAGAGSAPRPSGTSKKPPPNVSAQKAPGATKTPTSGSSATPTTTPRSSSSGGAPRAASSKSNGSGKSGTPKPHRRTKQPDPGANPKRQPRGSSTEGGQK
jgi:hypothetical protein